MNGSALGKADWDAWSNWLIETMGSEFSLNRVESRGTIGVSNSSVRVLTATKPNLLGKWDIPGRVAPQDRPRLVGAVWYNNPVPARPATVWIQAAPGPDPGQVGI